MISWEEQESWTVGDIVRRMREEEGMSLEQLSRGLCSSATLSRIEAGEREMDFLMASRVFQRLGYKIDKFEIYASEEELTQWDQRQRMEELAAGGQTKALEQALGQYQESWGEEIKKKPLQRQFIKYMEGLAKKQKKEWKEAEQLLRASASETIPGWEKESGTVALGELEMKILSCLADVCEELGQNENAETMRGMLIRNIGRKEERMRTYLALYTELLCKNAKKILEEKGSARTLRSVDQCLQIMQEEKKICHWPELLHIKSQCLETLFQEGKKEKETMLKSWQKTYYIYRLYERQEEAEKIRTYLEEAYQWECII